MWLVRVGDHAWVAWQGAGGEVRNWVVSVVCACMQEGLVARVLATRVVGGLT